MDRQSVFNQVAHALAVQGQRAMQGDSCRYRTVSGRKCGIGHLIHDADYEPSMEGLNVRQLLHPMLHGRHANPIPAYIRRDWEEHISFLSDLQVAHDGAHDGDDFIKGLERVARVYDLKISPELRVELTKVAPSWR